MREVLAALCLIGCAGCVDPEPVIEAVSVLGDTADEVGPYQIDAIVTGAEDVRVELAYAFDDTRVVFSRRMTRFEDDHYVATISGQPAGTRIFYFVRVMDGDDQLARDPDGISDLYGFAIVEDE